HSHLWDALRLELIGRSKESYRFVHDRVREATYSLIPDDLRSTAHLRTARLLSAHTPPEKREEAIFEIVNQFNRATELITSRDERDQVAELNLIAGQRAKSGAAYGSALNYLIAGTALVEEDCWERRHTLIFELELRRAECEFLTGEMKLAEERLLGLSSRAANAIERAAVAGLLADVYLAIQRLYSGGAHCLECLRQAGLDIPMHPTEADVQAGYNDIRSRLEGRAIEELAALPLMTDASSRATLDVLAKVSQLVFVANPNLCFLILCAAVN